MCVSLFNLSNGFSDWFIEVMSYFLTRPGYMVMFAFAAFVCVLYVVRAGNLLISRCRRVSDNAGDEVFASRNALREYVAMRLDVFFAWLGCDTPSALDFNDYCPVEYVPQNLAAPMRETFETLLGSEYTSRYPEPGPPGALVSFLTDNPNLTGVCVAGYGSRVKFGSGTRILTCLHVYLEVRRNGGDHLWLGGPLGRATRVAHEDITVSVCSYATDQVLLSLPENVYPRIGVKAARMSGFRQLSQVAMYTPKGDGWEMQVTPVKRTPESTKDHGMVCHLADTRPGFSGLALYQGGAIVGVHSAGAASGKKFNIAFSVNFIMAAARFVHRKKNLSFESYSTSDDDGFFEFRSMEEDDWRNDEREEEFLALKYDEHYFGSSRKGAGWVVHEMELYENDEWQPGDSWADSLADKDYEREFIEHVAWGGDDFRFESIGYDWYTKFLHILGKYSRAVARHDAGETSPSDPEDLKVKRPSQLDLSPSSEGQEPGLVTNLPAPGTATFAEALQSLSQLSSPSGPLNPAQVYLNQQVSRLMGSPPEEPTLSESASSTSLDEPAKPTGEELIGNPQDGSTQKLSDLTLTTLKDLLKQVLEEGQVTQSPAPPMTTKETPSSSSTAAPSKQSRRLKRGLKGKEKE